jgi:hypothetical protein
MKISEYKRHWRAIEVANGRSPRSGRPWKGLHGEIVGTAPTREQWESLDKYTKNNRPRRGIDHETNFLSSYGRHDYYTLHFMAACLRNGTLVIGGSAA